MRKHLRSLALGAAMAVTLAAAPALYAQDDLDMSHGPMMGRGMTGEGGMMGMMGGMMSGMMSMGGMMEHCSEMMQAMNDGHAQRPNEQWRSPAPEQRSRPQG